MSDAPRLEGKWPSLPNSLWVATAPPGPSAEPLSGEVLAEVTVVGGGYLGLSAALHLAEAGRSVIVLDSAEPGWGASGRNHGQIIPGLKLDPDEVVARLGPDIGERFVRWSGEAPSLVFDLIARHGLRCQAGRFGWIQPAHTPAAVTKIEARCAQWRSRGAPVEMIDAGALRASLGTSYYFGAWIDRRGGWLNPLAYSRELATASLRNGAILHSHTRAERLERVSGGGWIVHTARGSVRCDRVVIATAAYTGKELIPGLTASIIPLRSAQAATSPLSSNVAASILPGGQGASDTRRLLAAFRITPDRRLVMGGSGVTGGNEHGGLFAALHRSARELFGHLGELEWEFGWSGLLALTIDHLPHLHEPAAGLITALGCNGRGIAVSTAMGKIVSERLLGATEQGLPVPLTPIREIPMRRFWRLGVATALRAKRLMDAVDRRRSAPPNVS
jgi:glycine/D-amino acid oxidase-like deaminating enzyme